MDTIIMIGQIVLSLSILVGLHEIGHLLTAKLFGMRVEQYSIGFPPKIFGMKYGETEYSIGAIPLGGFVKISGMIDESLDTEKLKEEPKPYEFRAKPAWQRLIVMVGGIIVNVILGILIFICISYFYGDSYISKEEANRHGIYAYELGEEIGLQTGDKVIKINGQDYTRFSEVLSFDVLMEKGSYYTVDRKGEILDVFFTDDFLERLSEGDKGFITNLLPFEIGKVSKGTGADAAGLLSGDKIVMVNDTATPYFQHLTAILKKHSGDTVKLNLLRDGKNMTVKAGLNEDGELGFYPKSLLKSEHTSYPLLASFGVGTKKAFELVYMQIRSFGKILSGDVPLKAVKGPIGIAEIFGSTWDWFRFWSLTGMLSMWLAFVNFLPIPALDGGHVMFLSYEIISGRKPSDKFLENAQKVGMVFLLALMAFIIINDVVNLPWEKLFN